jgi:seryl-tRNA synthetase
VEEGKTRIEVTSKFVLSKEVENLKDVIESLVEKANKEVFVKGVPRESPEEAAKIVSWEVKNNSLTVKVSSGTRVRAPAAVLRFRKILAEELGLNYKVGVRKLEVPEIKFEFPIKTSKETLEKIQNLTHVQEAAQKENSVTVLLKPMEETDLKKNVPDRVFSVIREMFKGEAKPTPPPQTIVVRQSKPREPKFKEDPAKVALELGWIKEFPGRGQWIYTTPYTKLLEAIENILLEEVVWKLDFQPFMLPKLIPLEVMQRMPGYLEEIPEGMYYVCPPPRDPEAFSEFKEVVKVTKTVPKEMLKDIIKEPDYVLAPAQCEPFWYFFSHETLRVEDLPIKLYDRSGWTYRWEGGGVEGLARLQEFRRIELVYFGTPEQVVEIRDSIVERLVHVVDNVLELEWRVVAATPFYMREGEIGDLTDSKNIAAFDIEVYLPYRGEKGKAEWLEVAGCFIHKDKFIRNFSIHEARNRPIWTGCTGLGSSRWVTAFLANHGFNPKNWPLRVKEKFGSYKLPKTLLWPRRKLDELE